MASSTMSVKSSAVRSFTGMRPSLRPVQAAKVRPLQAWGGDEQCMLDDSERRFMSNVYIEWMRSPREP